jgi:hypothetical protein
VNYSGANRWNGYLTAFFTLYLRRDLKAAMLIWGEETGSLAKDSRISVAHRNKGSVLWLEAPTATLKRGEVTPVIGKLTKTTPLTKGAHYHLQAFKRIEDGADVDVGFEIQSTNEYEVDFILHISPKQQMGSKKAEPLEQKLTIIAINTNDGGSVSFHDVFLTVADDMGYSNYNRPAAASPSALVYDNQIGYTPLSPPSPSPSPSSSSSIVAFDEENWMSLRRRESSGSTSIDRRPVSGTRFTAVEGNIEESISSDGYDSWADVLYSSSKSMQKQPKTISLSGLQQQAQKNDDDGLLQGGGGELWKAQLFPSNGESSNVPSSLLPWESLLNSEQGSRSVVLGVSDFPAGYGDAQGGKPTPKERELMMWINTVRGSPQTFQGAYLTRGCSFSDFEANAKVSQAPLHFSDILSQAAQKHSHHMATDNFVSHIGMDDSTPFDRMDEVGYSRGYRGENICAGMKNPFDCIVSFMCSKEHRENVMSDTFREMGVGLSNKLASQYKNYWTLNLGHRGFVQQGKFVSSFRENGRHLRTLSIGSHRPEEPIDEVVFTSSYFDEERGSPRSISVIANGVEFPLELKYGMPHHGTYEQNIQLLSIPMWQVLSGSSPCIIYHFRATSADGRVYRFPELGSFGFGGCDFDDGLAKWVGFQNETTSLHFSVKGRRDYARPSYGDRSTTTSLVHVNAFDRGSRSGQGLLEFQDASNGICLTDLHLCADGKIVQRMPPACQFHCQSGDPRHIPTELDFLRLNGQKSFGGLKTCASTWAQFWSGIWNWCPDVLDEAWKDPENPYRWLIPLWKEVQKIDWVAASNAMTDFYQNMQQCKTYKPSSDDPQQNLMDSFTKSSIRIGHGEAIANMQRVIVKSNIKYEQYTSLKLYLSHKFMVDNTVVEKSILLGNSTNAVGEVMFDDFVEAPKPGWWGSWFETFAATVWTDLSKTNAQVQRYTVLNDRNVPVRAPTEALVYFTDKSSSSSAGIWELQLAHEDPVQSAAIGAWDLMICGEPVSTSLNFSSETHSCAADDRTVLAAPPFCSATAGSCGDAQRTNQIMHTCGSVSTVGGSSTQPPPSKDSSAFGSILHIANIMHVQPIKESSMYCSNSPVTQQGWARPRYPGSGLELGLYLFHHEDPTRENGAWRLVSSDMMSTTGSNGYSKDFAQVKTGGPESGCWIFYVVSLKGAGPYDFWLTSEY